MDDGAPFAALPLPLVHLGEQVEESLLGVGDVTIGRPAQELELTHHQLSLLELVREGKKAGRTDGRTEGGEEGRREGVSVSAKNAKLSDTFSGSYRPPLLPRIIQDASRLRARV